MIKIENTDLATEDKAMLLKVAELLMHVAGHGMIMVPDHKGVNPPEGVQALRKWLPTIEELTPKMREALLHPNELPPQTHAPYQHCGESDLTTHNLHAKASEELLETLLPTANPAPKHIDSNAPGLYGEPLSPIEAFGKHIADAAVAIASSTPSPLPDKPKRTRKSTPKPPLSAPKPPVFEVISQGEIDVIEETFLPDMPMVTDEIDTSMKLINKMTQLVTDKRISQEDLIQVIKTSGLNEVIDVCHREDLVPLVNSNLEILLRTKA